MPDEREFPRVTHPHSAVLKTSQEDRLSSNINTIVAQYQRSGTMPNVGLRNPLYGDFSLIGDDLQDLTEMLQRADDRFGELPSAVRQACKFDYRNFIRMFDDPVEREVLIAAGLGVVDLDAPVVLPPAPAVPEPPPSPEPPVPPVVPEV